MQDSDAALIARIIASGDRAAFEALVRRHQSPVRNFLRRLARNDAALADDMAQETFLRLFRSIHAFRGQARFSTWLYRIAYNVFVDDRRSHAARAQAGAVDTSGSETAHDAGDEVDFDRMMAHLSDRQRAIFDLHYRKGMTHTEIADAVELPLGTVKSDLARGLAVLRERFSLPEQA